MAFRLKVFFILMEDRVGFGREGPGRVGPVLGRFLLVGAEWVGELPSGEEPALLQHGH